MQASTLIKRALAVGAGILAAAAVAAAPASAASKDRNHDSIPDRWESHHGLSLDKNQARKDQDRDGLRNRGEFRAKFDPRDEDSDDDGVEDGDEGAGTIESFDAASGELVINAFSGDTIKGTVTADTEIECDNDDDVQPDDGDVDDGDVDDVDDGDVDDVDDGDVEDKRTSRGHDGDDEGDADSCTTADLTQGTVVREAELELTASGLVFEEIEL
ncbi:MAG: hypothetical protein ACHQJ5_04510 [Vicinamibacteria bacterium]